MVKDGKPKAGA